MKRFVSLLGMCALFSATDCDRLTHRAKPSADAISPESDADIKDQLRKLSGDLVQEAFDSPDVAANQDAVWSKVFEEPSIAKAVQDLVSAIIEDPKVANQVQTLMAEVVKDPQVVAKLKEIAKAGGSQQEIQARIEAYFAGIMASPAVNRALDQGVQALIASPDVEARLRSIFDGAGVGPLVKAAMKEPLGDVEKSFDQRLTRVQNEGKLDAYLADWRAAARKDPATQTAVKDFCTSAIQGVADSEEVKNTLREGFASERTRKIFASATSDLLADPDIKSAAQDFFRAVLAGSDPQTIAQKTEALFKLPVMGQRLRAAILELLSSKLGAARLSSAVLSGMSSPDAAKKVRAFVVALMNTAPPA